MTTTINNEHKKLNVPNLRFKEFEGEWEKCKLGDLCNVLMCKRILASQTNTEEGVPFYKIGTIGNAPDAYISKELFDDYKTKYNYPHKGEVMITCAGTVGKCVIYDGKDAYYQDSNIVWIDNPSQCISNSFLYHLLAKVDWRKLNSTTIIRIYNDDLRNLKLSYPQIEEQKKISRLLSLLDERIATQNKIIEDLKKLKSAISHILFSSKGAIHLSEIANVVMGQSPSSNAYNDQGLGMPLVQGNLDISNGKTTPRLYTAEFNQTTEKGNIILTVRAPVGEVAKATQKVCLGRGVCAIIPHEENMSDFIYQYLTFYKFMWRRYEQGSTFTSINGSDVRNIFCPKVRNVSILTLLDIKINIEERVVKQYQSQKQYMLYQMFI